MRRMILSENGSDEMIFLFFSLLDNSIPHLVHLSGLRRMTSLEFHGSCALCVIKGRVLVGAVQSAGNDPFPMHHHMWGSSSKWTGTNGKKMECLVERIEKIPHEDVSSWIARFSPWHVYQLHQPAEPTK